MSAIWHIDGIELRRTCSVCPEQYDAFLDDIQVGYLRLRGGWFRVDFGECGGDTIFEAYPDGDGTFEDSERDTYLRAAVGAIRQRLQAALDGQRRPIPAV